MQNHTRQLHLTPAYSVMLNSRNGFSAVFNIAFLMYAVAKEMLFLAPRNKILFLQDDNIQMCWYKWSLK